MDIIKEILPFLIPLILVQLGLAVFSIIDLVKRKKVKYDNKILWGIIIILVNIVGPIIYLTLGRKEEEDDDKDGGED